MLYQLLIKIVGRALIGALLNAIGGWWRERQLKKKAEREGYAKRVDEERQAQHDVAEDIIAAPERPARERLRDGEF